MLCRMCPSYVAVEPAPELKVGFSRFSELYQENLLLQRSCGLGLLGCWKCLVEHTCPWKYHTVSFHLHSSPSRGCYLNGFSSKFLPICLLSPLSHEEKVSRSKCLCYWQLTYLPSTISLVEVPFWGCWWKGWETSHWLQASYCWDSSSENMLDASQTQKKA